MANGWKQILFINDYSDVTHDIMHNCNSKNAYYDDVETNDSQTLGYKCLS